MTEMVLTGSRECDSKLRVPKDMDAVRSGHWTVDASNSSTCQPLRLPYICSKPARVQLCIYNDTVETCASDPAQHRRLSTTTHANDCERGAAAALKELKEEINELQDIIRAMAAP